MARQVPLRSLVEDDRGLRHALAEVRLEDDVSFRLRGRSFVDSLEDQPEADPVKVSVLVRRRILRSQGPPPERTWWFWTLLALLLVPIEVMAVAAYRTEQSTWTLFLPFLIAALWILAIFQDRSRRRKDAARVGELPPVCIACVHDLSGVPQAPDGCTVCPECGAAWRLGCEGAESGRSRRG